MRWGEREGRQQQAKKIQKDGKQKEEQQKMTGDEKLHWDENDLKR